MNNNNNPIEEYRLDDIWIEDERIGVYRGFKDVWNYNNINNFSLFRTYPINTNLSTLLHYLDEGFIILRCIRVYKIVRMSDIQIFRDYYNRRLSNPQYYRTYYDSRYITLYKS